MPAEHSYKWQGAQHARGSGGLVKQRPHTTELKPIICHEYQWLLLGSSRDRVTVTNNADIIGQDDKVGTSYPKAARSPMSPLSKPSWKRQCSEAAALEHAQKVLEETGKKRSKLSAILSKALPKVYFQGQHLPVRVKGHQVFIWTLTESSVALVKLH